AAHGERSSDGTGGNGTRGRAAGKSANGPSRSRRILERGGSRFSGSLGLRLALAATIAACGYPAARGSGQSVPSQPGGVWALASGHRRGSPGRPVAGHPGPAPSDDPGATQLAGIAGARPACGPLARTGAPGPFRRLVGLAAGSGARGLFLSPLRVLASSSP